MALVKCAECGKEISELAKVCPSCGAPNKYFQVDKPLEGEVYTPCAKHHDRKAVNRCSECGKGMCKECSVGSVTFADGSRMCPQCYLKKLKSEKRTDIKDIIVSSIGFLWFVFWGIVATASVLKRPEFDFGAFWLGLTWASFLPMLILFFSKDKKEKNAPMTKKEYKEARAELDNPLASLIGGLIAWLLIGPILGIFYFFIAIITIVLAIRDYRKKKTEIVEINNIIIDQQQALVTVNNN